MGKPAPEAGGADVLLGAAGSGVSHCRQEDRHPGGKNILVSDAQKHVFKAPVYNVHLCIIIFFLKSSLNGIAVL